MDRPPKLLLLLRGNNVLVTEITLTDIHSVLQTDATGLRNEGSSLSARE